MEFNKDNYYFCSCCGEYSMVIVREDDRDWVVHRTFECLNCGAEDYDTVDLDLL